VATLKTTPTRAVCEAAVDAARYRRLRILGCATGISEKHLQSGTVMCFTNLDAHVDADIAAHPSRGEAIVPEVLDEIDRLRSLLVEACDIAEQHARRESGINECLRDIARLSQIRALAEGEGK
jgi:hypothetical protein